MQARIKQSSRYGSVQLFSGLEFVKREWRKVPDGFEEQARSHELLDVREGKAEKEVVQKQAEEKIVPVMKARLIPDYKDDSLRIMGDILFIKDEWTAVPEGNEEGARDDELLQIWEAGEAEPKGKAGKSSNKNKNKSSNKNEIPDTSEGEE